MRVSPEMLQQYLVLAAAQLQEQAGLQAPGAPGPQQLSIESLGGSPNGAPATAAPAQPKYVLPLACA